MAANFDGKSTFFSNSFLSPSQTLKFNVSTVKVPIFVYNFPPTQLEIRRRFKGKRSRLPRLCRPPPPDPATSRWNAETVADGQDSTRGCGRHLLLARQPRSRLKRVGRISRRVRGVLVTITYKYNNNFAVHILIQKDGGNQTVSLPNRREEKSRKRFSNTLF